MQDNVLKKVSEAFNQHANVINNKAKQMRSLSQVHGKKTKKLWQLISLYAELATWGVMDGKRKENLRVEINDLINEK